MVTVRDRAGQSQRIILGGISMYVFAVWTHRVALLWRIMTLRGAVLWAEWLLVSVVGRLNWSHCEQTHLVLMGFFLKPN